MTFRLLTILPALVLAASLALAETAEPPASPEDFFHNASQTFIVEGVEPAKELVEQALMVYPDDIWLQALRALLERPPQEQPESGDSQQDQQPDQQDQQQQDESEGESDPSGPPEESPQPPEPQDESEAESDETEPQEVPLAEADDSEPLSEDDAMMLLDAMRQREQAERENLIRREIQRNLQQMPPVERDW